MSHEQLTPDQLSELVRLNEAARSTRLEYVEVLKQEQSTKLRKARAKEAKRIAQAENVAYYTSLGLSRQVSWQLDRVARGLCRLCSEPAPTGLCETCRAKPWKTRAKNLRKKK